MYNPSEIKSFCPKTCFLKPSSNFLHERNAITRMDLSYGTVPGAGAQMVRLFLVFTYTWQEDVLNISEAPRARAM